MDNKPFLAAFVSILLLLVSLSIAILYHDIRKMAVQNLNRLEADKFHIYDATEDSESSYEEDFKKVIKYVKSHKYINALNIIKNIAPKDTEARRKMLEIITLYFDENMASATEHLNRKELNMALECLDSILFIYEQEKEMIKQDRKIKLKAETAQERARLIRLSQNADKSYPVSILMYHSISNQPGNQLCIPAEKFRSEMKYLKEMNYNVINLDELYWCYTNNIPVPPKTVIITLDDGYSDNYANAYPVLKELGLKATIFVITSTIDTNPAYITSMQIKEMDENKVHIESHTVNHDSDKKLGTLPYKMQLEYLKESKRVLEELLGREVNCVCYPSGSYNSDTIKAAKEAGYKIGVTIESGRAEKSNGLLTLKRIYVGNNYSVDFFKQLVR